MLVVGLAACISDNPTGVSHVGLNYVENIRMFQAQRLLVVDEIQECEVVDFEEFTGDSVHDPLAFTVFGVAGTADITGYTDSVSDCGTGDIIVFDTGTPIPGAEDDDLRKAGNSAGLTLGNVVAHQSCESDGIPGNAGAGAYADTQDATDNVFAANDADVMTTMTFTLPADDWSIASFAALDQENDGEGIQVWPQGVFAKGTNAAVNFADSVEIVVVDVNEDFSTYVTFEFAGSGAIDDLEICRMVERGGEGCMPGYWKQSQHFGSWSVNPYTTDFDDVFVDACNNWDRDLQNPESGKICDISLLEALSLKGGGINALGRHAAAAWLNTASVDFYYSAAEVENMVDKAFETEIYNITKDGFADANEAGCPLARDLGDWEQP
jgi:hypothetical protein